MKTWKAKFYSGAVMRIKAKDYYGAKGRIDGYIKSCKGKPVLFSLCLVD